MQKQEYVASTIPATAYATGANLEAHVCVTIGADHMCNWANIKFGIDSGTMKIYADGAVTGFVSDGEELMTAYEGFHYYDQSTYMPYNISVIGTANSSGNRGNSVSIKYDRVTASDWSTLYSTATEVEFYCFTVTINFNLSILVHHNIAMKPSVLIKMNCSTKCCSTYNLKTICC